MFFPILYDTFDQDDGDSNTNIDHQVDTNTTLSISNDVAHHINTDISFHSKFSDRNFKSNGSTNMRTNTYSSTSASFNYIITNPE